MNPLVVRTKRELSYKSKDWWQQKHGVMTDVCVVAFVIVDTVIGNGSLVKLL